MPCALLSVHDKTHLLPFVKGLFELGWEFLASGNTAAVLHNAGFSVVTVEDYTQYPALLGGRVKTLHPAIHCGLLARDTQEDLKVLNQKSWRTIDLVVVNLYPFAETIQNPTVTLEEVIEQIDVGGVALLRSAAKNWQRVITLTESADYSLVLEKLRCGAVTPELRKRLASLAFLKTSQYDAAIAQYLSTNTRDYQPLHITLYPGQPLRYGENPHQTARVYHFSPTKGPLGGVLLQGKPLSYNNLLDLDAAWRTVLDFEEPTIAIIKHLSPCGVASSNQLAEAFQQAFNCDPISAFGSVIASNRPIDEATVLSMGTLFIECLVAHDFTESALVLLAKRTQCRLLKVPLFNPKAQEEWRSIEGGLLIQTRDLGDPSETPWTVVTTQQPSLAEKMDLAFAWRVCQHVKSNAIVLAARKATIGIGGGQPNRVDCLHLAAKRASSRTPGAVLASDAFFPFPDVLEVATQYGIHAMIQPGGSIRDPEVIATANRLGLCMITTGVRHFRH